MGDNRELSIFQDRRSNIAPSQDGEEIMREFEELGLSQREQDEIERRALEGFVQEHGPEVLDNPIAVMRIIQFTEPYADRRKFENSIRAAAAELAKTYEISVDAALRLLAERAIIKWSKEREE